MSVWVKKKIKIDEYFARVANTLLKDEESARDNHVLACNLFTDFFRNMVFGLCSVSTLINVALSRVSFPCLVLSHSPDCVGCFANHITAISAYTLSCNTDICLWKKATKLIYSLITLSTYWTDSAH